MSTDQLCMALVVQLYTELVARGVLCHMSQTCSFTSGYEEIRLGSYPLMDKNNSHIHPDLFSSLTHDWVIIQSKSSSVRLPVHQICLYVSCCSVTFCNTFLTSPSQVVSHSLILFNDLCIDPNCRSQAKMKRHGDGDTLNICISSNGIKWLSLCPFDCPAGQPRHSVTQNLLT